MAYDFSIFEKVNFKKILIQIYFIFFIILNIGDFLGVLSYDIDFFKKILSWILIGVIFYQVSLTKLFVGKRIKIYDLGLILAYCFMTIVKSIAIYIKTFPSDLPLPFFIFGSILEFFRSFSLTNFVVFNFIIGVILLILVTIKLLSNYEYSQYSLLGSFNFSEYLKFIKFDYMMFFVLNLFFSLTIFNLFMEWFALAVDSIILVLGLIYYIVIYIHKHTKINTDFLSNVSNTGGAFFSYLISTFYSRKTIFIGIGFLLTLHTLVDAGVFMVPYTIGTGSSFYFDSLDLGGTDHTPIFNLKNVSDSQFAQDYNFIFNSQDTQDYGIINKIVMLLVVLLIDIASIFLFFSLLVLPFYLFYKTFKKEQFQFNKWFLLFLIISFIFIFVVNCFVGVENENDTSYRYIDIEMLPIGIENPSSQTSIDGINLYTHSVLDNFNHEKADSLFEVYIVFILFLVIFLFVVFRFFKYQYFYQQFVYWLIFIFFIIYMMIFFISVVENEFMMLSSITKNSQDLVDIDYNESVKLFYILEDNNYYNNIYDFNSSYLEYNIYMRIFSTLEKDKSMTDNNHSDYLYIYISNGSMNNLNIFFNDPNNVYLEKGTVYNLEKNRIISNDSNKVEVVYYLGDNVLRYDDRQIIIPNLNEFFSLKYNHLQKDNANYLELFNFIFILIFYIFGIFVFIKVYVKDLLLSRRM